MPMRLVKMPCLAYAILPCMALRQAPPGPHYGSMHGTHRSPYKILASSKRLYYGTLGFRNSGLEVVVWGLAQVGVWVNLGVSDLFISLARRWPLKPG